jgi:hypothetical protein
MVGGVIEIGDVVDVRADFWRKEFRIPKNILGARVAVQPGPIRVRKRFDFLGRFRRACQIRGGRDLGGACTRARTRARSGSRSRRCSAGAVSFAAAFAAATAGCCAAFNSASNSSMRLRIASSSWVIASCCGLAAAALPLDDPCCCAASCGLCAQTTLPPIDTHNRHAPARRSDSTAAFLIFFLLAHTHPSPQRRSAV